MKPPADAGNFSKGVEMNFCVGIKKQLNFVAACALLATAASPMTGWAKNIWIQCAGCGELRKVNDEQKDFFQTSWYCWDPKCQEIKRQEVKRNKVDAARQIVVELSIEEIYRKTLAAYRKDMQEFCRYIVQSNNNDTPADEIIKMCHKYWEKVGKHKCIRPVIGLEEYIVDMEEHPITSGPEGPSAYRGISLFWACLAMCKNIDVIKHFWPKPATAQEYEKYYTEVKKNAQKVNSTQKRIIAPLAWEPDKAEDRVRYADASSAVVIATAMNADNIVALNYFIEQCSPNSDFLLPLIVNDTLEHLISGDSKREEITDEIRKLQDAIEKTAEKFEKKKFQKQLAELQKKLDEMDDSMLSVGPNAWQVIASRLTENAYVNFFCLFERKDVACWNGYGSNRSVWNDIGARFAQSGDRASLAMDIFKKKLMQIACPARDKYLQHQKFLESTKTSKWLLDPCHPVWGSGDAKGHQRMWFRAGMENPMRSGYLYREPIQFALLHGKQEKGGWTWTPGLKHHTLPYKAGEKEGEWIWVSGQASTMMPGYLSGKEDHDWVWTPGLLHANDPSLVAGKTKDTWILLPGFKREEGKLPVWVPGTASPQASNVVSGKTVRSWVPAPGYQWKNPAAAKDFSVVKSAK